MADSVPGSEVEAYGVPLDLFDLANVLHAYQLARPEGDPFQRYLDFQKKWARLMEFVDAHQLELRARVFG